MGQFVGGKMLTLLFFSTLFYTGNESAETIDYEFIKS